MKTFNKAEYERISILDKQKYIKLIKDKFERSLAEKLSLIRVTAPLIVTRESGLQDDLSGIERKVAFDLGKNGKTVEIVQSLAKWKRYALGRYNIPVGSGIYTDMTAIRRDDKMDETHSVYVDQWDWEKPIERKDRTTEYLKDTVKKIVAAIADTAEYVSENGFKAQKIEREPCFITAQDLEDEYPDKTPKEREYLIAKEKRTVFIIGIGGDLKSGAPHDLRAPDYDDWSLNGDLLVFSDVLSDALEISSMGIRVDEKSLMSQLEKSGHTERLAYDFHRSVLKGELPLSIGGGIGQSRLCQLILKRAHVGEVQSSYWDEENLSYAEKNGIELL